MKFNIEYTNLDITSSGGLPLVGYLLDKCDRQIPVIINFPKAKQTTLLYTQLRSRID